MLQLNIQCPKACSVYVSTVCLHQKIVAYQVSQWSDYTLYNAMKLVNFHCGFVEWIIGYFNSFSTLYYIVLYCVAVYGCIIQHIYCDNYMIIIYGIEHHSITSTCCISITCIIRWYDLLVFPYSIA